MRRGDGIRSAPKVFSGKGWGCVRLARRRGNGPIGRGPEREAPHTGTETRPRLLREAAVRNIGQWARA